MQLNPTIRIAASAVVVIVAGALVRYVPASAGTSWTEVAVGLGAVSTLMVGVLAVLWIGGLTANSVALAASLPGLTTRRALTLSLSGSAVANLLPLGGAAGVGLNYAMTRRWGFSRTSFAAYTMTTNICDVASKFVVAGLASVILLVGGRSAVLEHGATPALALLAVLPVGMALLLHRPCAAWLGRVLDRVTAGLGRCVRRTVRTHLADRLPQLSAMTVALLKRQWLRLGFGSCAYAALQAALLWGCMHAAGLDLSVTLLACAFAVDRLLTLLPLTPGGVGVVEGGMAAVLTALGAAPTPVVAGVLLYRGFTYLAEIPVGGLTALGWSVLNRRPARPAAVPVAEERLG